MSLIICFISSLQGKRFNEPSCFSYDAYSTQPDEKESRSKRMIEMGNICEAEFCASQVGLITSVLFEQQENGFWEGYSPNYTRVKVKSNDNLSRQIIEIKIISAEHDFCYGEIVGK